MTTSARDIRYGRRGGRWAEDWTDEDEARYQAALTDRNNDSTPDDDPPSLFDEDDDQ